VVTRLTELSNPKLRRCHWRPPSCHVGAVWGDADIRYFTNMFSVASFG
jgi:hypothetical protein